MKKTITFQINYHKILESVVYCAFKMGGSINKYNLMKVIFFADKYHLNRYMRPITGDRYVKMQYGTVPSATKDMIDTKDRDWVLHTLQIDDYPFSCETVKTDYLIKAKREPKIEYFSESDVEALDKGIAEYGNLSFKEVERKNHEETCWQKTDMNKDISFDLMIDDEKTRQYLREYSSIMVL